MLKFMPVENDPVTYAIPFVSLAIGLYYNEPIHPLRLVGLGIILCGVYIVNKQKK